MTTKTANTKISLQRRIRQFYELLNQHEFGRCYRMIDPSIRDTSSSITMFQYAAAGREFLEQVGSVCIREITIELHLGEPSPLYKGRDFAVGKTTWVDHAGKQHIFAERWIREGRAWYTRCTGFTIFGDR